MTAHEHAATRLVMCVVLMVAAVIVARYTTGPIGMFSAVALGGIALATAVTATVYSLIDLRDQGKVDFYRKGDRP